MYPLQQLEMQFAELEGFEFVRKSCTIGRDLDG
jgi:hypothetical protein